jgi:hypothetical protein
MLPGSPEAAAAAAKDAAESQFLAALAAPNPHTAELAVSPEMLEDGGA